MIRRLRDSALVCGLRLALTMFTVAPVKVRRVDRQVGGVAMALAPAVGAILGAVLGCVGVGARLAAGGPLLAGALVVTLDALLTRGLHLDGIADTADALGSYRDRQTSLDIMKRSDIGPFGVAAITLTLLLQTAALTEILPRSALAAVVSVTIAAATGRVAVTLACRKGVPAARETGLGAMFAGTVAPVTAATAAIGVGLLAISAVPTRPWQGPVVVAAALGCAFLLTRHAVRRLGGITGDVLGAGVQVATTLTLVGLALGGP